MVFLLKGINIGEILSSVKSATNSIRISSSSNVVINGNKFSGNNIVIVNGKIISHDDTKLQEKELSHEEIVKEHYKMMSVAIPWADIHIRQEDRDATEIKFSGKISTDEKYDPQLVVEKRGSALEISLKEEPDNISIFNSEDVKLEVALPKDCPQLLDIQTASGDLYVDRLTVPYFSFKTADGDIRVNEIDSAEISLDTLSGDISVKELIGGLQANTASGDIKLRTSRLNGNLNLNSTSGDIKITLPGNSSFSINASTMGGDFESDFDILTSYKKSGSGINGHVGENPTNVIKVNTMSGDIEINKR